jgi:FtsH-binding integral membrane protein
MSSDLSDDMQSIEAEHNVGGETLLKMASASIRLGFVRKVYLLLSTQLLLTILVAIPFQLMDTMQLQSQTWLLWLSVCMTLMTVFTMSFAKSLTRTYPYNYVFLFAFTLFEAILMGFASASYTWQSVMLCAGLTAVIFLGLTIYAAKTETDFTGFGPMLFGALLSLVAWGIMICTVAAFGAPLDMVTMLCSLVGLIVFVIYIIYDTQLIIGGEHKTHEFTVDDYVFAAMSLYLDILQLFLRILGLFGKKKRK